MYICTQHLTSPIDEVMQSSNSLVMKHIIQKAHARLDGMKVPVSQDQKDQKWAVPVLEGGRLATTVLGILALKQSMNLQCSGRHGENGSMKQELFYEIIDYIIDIYFISIAQDGT